MNDSELMKATLFRSHYDAAKEMSPETRLVFYDALFDYQFTGNAGEMPPAVKWIMTAILPTINKELEGKQGGRTQKALPPTVEIEAMRSELGSMDAVANALGIDKATIYRHMSKEKQGKECCKTGAKCNVASVAVSQMLQKQNVERENVERENVEREKQKKRVAQCAPVAAEPPTLSVSENPFQNPVLFPTEQTSGFPQQAEQPQEKQKQQKSAAFIAPTVEEVAAYCKERNNGIDAESFVAFYASKGWFVGKNKMKDWRQAVITWEKRSKEQAQNNARASPPAPQYKTWRAEDMPKVSEKERAAVSEGLSEIFGKLGKKIVAGG